MKKNNPQQQEGWSDEFDKWFNHGTKEIPHGLLSSDYYKEIKAFIQDLLDKKAIEIEKLRPPENLGKGNIPWYVEGFNSCLDQALSILKGEE